MNNRHTVRAFIALTLPPPVKEMLANLATELAVQTPPGAVRWVKPEALHVTLRFLGETAVTLLPTLGEQLDQLADRHRQFALTTVSLGCFPNPRRPRVIWVGLETDSAALSELKQALDELLAPLGWPPETKPFHPHLTLGRLKDDRARLVLPWGELAEQERWPVTAVHLIQSDLLPAGPKYRVLRTAVLPS
jgi:RNA 2',3'-cyclic 3'-phosphodiesterase